MKVVGHCQVVQDKQIPKQNCMDMSQSQIIMKQSIELYHNKSMTGKKSIQRILTMETELLRSILIRHPNIVPNMYKSLIKIQFTDKNQFTRQSITMILTDGQLQTNIHRLVMIKIHIGMKSILQLKSSVIHREQKPIQYGMSIRKEKSLAGISLLRNGKISELDISMQQQSAYQESHINQRA